MTAKREGSITEVQPKTSRRRSNMASKSKKSLPKFTIVKHPDPYNVLPKHEDVRVNVTIGYHTLRLKPGQSVRTNKAGNIFIVSMRGNITDTK